MFFVYRCDQGVYRVERKNATKEYFTQESRNTFGQDLDARFVIMASVIVSLLLCCVFLLTIICKTKKRPRIKKRIIVNKNVTPLTYRPQPPTEQCEITIENCCNMNVCETVSIYFFRKALKYK